jgi:chloramphenicol 3-O-phosphotransferase
LQVRELAASDPSVWSYQPEIESVSFGSTDLRANHIIVSGKPPAGTVSTALTTAETFDDAQLRQIGLERLLHHVDPKLTTSAQCAQKASFLLAQEVRAQLTHTVTVPLNPALQLFDGLTLSDSAAPLGSGQSSLCRVLVLRAHYDARHALNEMQIELEGL